MKSVFLLVSMLSPAYLNFYKGPRKHSKIMSNVAIDEDLLSEVADILDQIQDVLVCDCETRICTGLCLNARSRKGKEALIQLGQ